MLHGQQHVAEKLRRDRGLKLSAILISHRDVKPENLGIGFIAGGGKLRILGPGMNETTSFGTPVGAKYSPNSDVLYVPVAGTSIINAYDSNTFGVLRSYDTGKTFPTHDWSWMLTDAFVWPRLAVSSDGRFLAVTVDGGAYGFLAD